MRCAPDNLNAGFLQALSGSFWRGRRGARVAFSRDATQGYNSAELHTRIDSSRRRVIVGMFDDSDWIDPWQLHTPLEAPFPRSVSRVPFIMTSEMTSEPPSTGPTPPRSRWAFAGVILMSLSLLLWVSLLGVPFLPVSMAGRGAVATAVIVVAEVAFWVGAAMAGPEAARRMRSWWRTSRASASGPAD